VLDDPAPRRLHDELSGGSGVATGVGVGAAVGGGEVGGWVGDEPPQTVKVMAMPTTKTWGERRT
jgi:hypothetical protein